MGMLTLSMIALILGALSIPCAFLALLGWGAILSVLFVAGAFAVGALGMMRDREHSGLALIGMACALIGLIIAIICFSCAGCAACQGVAAAAI